MALKQPLKMVVNINSKEWLWAAGWSLAICLAANLPYLYGALLSTPANPFGGFVIGLEDGNSYLAKMQLGRAGYWLFYMVYTPEPHQGGLFFIYYILLGKLAGLVGWSNIVVFHLSKLFTIPLALLAFYFFAAYFVEPIKTRRLAFFIFGLTGGLGWLWLSLGGSAELGQMPVDLWVPDASFFLSALTYPHLPLGQGLLLILVVTGLEFVRTGRKRPGLIAALTGLLVSLIHPYTLPITGFLMGVYSLWRHRTNLKHLYGAALRLALIALPSLPYLVYVLLIFWRNPVFASWREQSLTFSPPPLHYLLGFGLPLLLAAIGLWRTRAENEPITFLHLWLIIIPILLYLPIALQRRFLDGYQAPVAVLAATGFIWLVEHTAAPKRWSRLLTLSLWLVMSLTNILLLGVSLLTLPQRPTQLFLTGAEVEAARWLAGHTHAEVVLAAYETGNFLPTQATVRVFVGHGPETVNSDQKRDQARQFFTGAVDESWRVDLLRRFNIAYVFYGPNEKAAGDFDPAAAPYLTEIYGNSTVKIYKTRLP